MSASCSKDPDSRRSLIMGLRSVRPSELRLSWATATTGMSRSLASSLRLRDMAETSCWRDSTWRPMVMSCR